jgi:fructokinase
VAQHRFLVVGEALVDVVVPAGGSARRSPGGSPLNVAVGLARLGISTTLMTEVGDDELGRLVLDHLEGSGVAVYPGSVLGDRGTSTATARLDGAGAASYDFDLSWELGPRDLPEDVTALHVGSLGAALRPGRDQVVRLVQQAAERGLPVTFDPNARPSLTPEADAAWRDALEVAASASVVKLSDEDLDFLAPGTSPDELAATLLAGGTRLVVVTFGGGGAFAASPEAVVRTASRPVEVADTVGAGDSFMAALLAVVVEHGLDALGADRLEQYVAAAHEAAAVTVSRPGADPPRREELPQAWPGVD